MQSAPRILVVEHEAACPPARFGRWLTDAGAELDLIRPWAGEALPADLADHDALLVLGGTMSATDDDRYPWLGATKDLIRDAVREDLPVLGICLGHQLIAAALGGEVRRNPLGQQVGLLRTRWLPDAATDPLVRSLSTLGAASVRGIHWNDDVVAVLPEGATVLAETERGEIQVARFAVTAWGVQLHPEADAAVVTGWADNDADRHREQGIDTAALIAEIADAHDELAAAWAPLAAAFARLAADDWTADDWSTG